MPKSQIFLHATNVVLRKREREREREREGEGKERERERGELRKILHFLFGF